MRHALLTVVLLAWGCSAFARPYGPDCRYVPLPANDLSRIRISAKAVTRAAMETKTLRMCRYRESDSFTVYFDTKKVSEADGAERWYSLACSSDYLRNAPWDCDGYDSRGIRVIDVANAQPLLITIPLYMDAARARQRVAEAFSLLGRNGEATSCVNIQGVESVPEFSDAEPGTIKAFSELRSALHAGVGEPRLELDKDGFALSGDLVNVHFVFMPPDGAPQVRCWSHTVILVTS